MDKAAGTLVVDRFLHTPMRWRMSFSENRYPLFRDMREAGGDEKVLAVPMPKLTKRYAHVMNYTDLPEITLQQMRHFFETWRAGAAEIIAAD